MTGDGDAGLAFMTQPALRLRAGSLCKTGKKRCLRGAAGYSAGAPTRRIDRQLRLTGRLEMLCCLH